MVRAKTLVKQIADLSGPVLKGILHSLSTSVSWCWLMKDFDPEEGGHDVRSDQGSGSEVSEDDLAGTEHYDHVGWVVVKQFYFSNLLLIRV